MSTTRTDTTGAAAPAATPVAGPPAAGPGTPEGRLAGHLAAGRRRELWWVFDLGRLARACCRARRHGDGAVPALAAANGTSKQRLYRAMQFARLFTPAGVRRLAAAGLTWGKVSQVLRLDPGERDAALAEAAAGRMTDRQFRVLLDERHGPGLPRGGRPVAPLPGRSGAVRAKALAADGRRLVRRHAATPAMLEGVLTDLADGRVLTPAEAARFRSAIEAVAAAVDLLQDTHAALVRIAAADAAAVAARHG